jgi:hypothetical protein
MTSHILAALGWSRERAARHDPPPEVTMIRRMIHHVLLPWVTFLMLPALLVAGCAKRETAEQPAPAGGLGAGAGTSGDGAYPAATPAAPAGAPAEAPAAAPAAPPAAPAAAGTVIASQETNWQGVVADVTELRRKGNTLTAKVRLRNGSPDQQEVSVKFDEVYLMDAPNAKKYEVLRDEKGTYIAAVRSNWTDRWYDTLDPQQSYLLWIKFPAPPAEVRTITLQLPNTPPFEDLPIQDG